MSKKSKVTQSNMFVESCADLPLFSQSAPTVIIDQYIGSEVSSQPSMASCGSCLDTGKIGDKPCWCQAGDQYRMVSKEDRPTNMPTAPLWDDGCHGQEDVTDQDTPMVAVPALSWPVTPRPQSCNVKTPLTQRLYLRCQDCLALTCIELDESERNKVTCGICGGRMEYMGHVKGVKYNHQVEVCDCDSRCQCATGPDCECRCHGENHGVGFKYHIEIDKSGSVKVTPVTDTAKCLARATEYRAEYDAAMARIKKTFGEYWTMYNQGRWIDDQKIWRACSVASYALTGARDGRQHTNRIKKLQSICKA